MYKVESALELFDSAKRYVIDTGQMAEIDWQRQASCSLFTESDLLREVAWVILCSGFREKTVRQVFDYISLCFCDWESAFSIVQSGSICRLTAMARFGNSAKLEAISAAASYISERGFSAVKDDILANPEVELQKFNFIGPITFLHLAKNLGFDVAKPDRHLVRVSHALGFRDATHFCREIAEAVGEQVKVVDLIIWRYVADNRWAISA